MVLIENIERLKEVLFRVKSNGKSISLVPTMGALHQGHLSLIEKARHESQVVVVTIFVNPTQFNNAEDLEKYPRTLEKDLELIQEYTDIVFAPPVEEMFPTPPAEKYNFGSLEKVMEGASRPGHFNGVGIIVKRFFDLIKPDKAYFGEKDFQQLAIIKDLVKQNNIEITIVPCPIIREENGLAMSSRNQRLTKEQRDRASRVYQILLQSQKMNTQSIQEICTFVKSEIAKMEDIQLDYFQIVDDTTLEEVEKFDNHPGVVGCVAFFIGNVRLIDNIRYH
jgi:pantoate--beta-alanine ligase